MMSEISPYVVFNRWMRSGDNKPVPEEIIKMIGVSHIFYYFRDSRYLLWLSTHLNNYYLFKIDPKYIFLLMKDMYRRSKYVPPFKQSTKTVNTKITSLYTKLVERYPLLNRCERLRLIDHIDNHPDMEKFYSTFGLRGTRRTKTTTVSFEKLSKKIVKTSNKGVSFKEFIGKFKIKEC